MRTVSALENFINQVGPKFTRGSGAGLGTRTILEESVTPKEKSVIRKLSSFVFAVVAIVSIVTSASQAQSFMTRHVREVTVNGQSQSVGRLPATQSMRFDVVLPLRHQPELQNFLQEIYDPSSPSYRHFVTPQEFTARFGSSQEDYDAVLAFAKASGFTVVGGSRDSRDIQLKGTVAAIEKAFRVTMGVYQHPTENRTFYSPDREPTVNLPFPLWHVSGLDNYSIPRPASLHRNLKAKPQTVQGSCPGGYYCGSDMRAAYYGQTTLTGSGQTLGLLEYVGYDIADLQTYYENTGQTDNVPVIGISTDGTAVSCTYPNCDDTEQILDMTQAISMAPAMTGLYVYVGSTDTAMLSSMATNTPLNAQLSCSWAWQPADPSTDDPYYQQFAAQGQSFFTASGDAGSYPNGTPYYYPAEDANVTAVGGTDLVTQGAGGPWSSETAWSLSGGGISQDGIPIPSYQQLAGVINSSNGGSNTLRNIPDVSGEANFDFYVCYNQGGCAGGWGGTSFAAPMWAGYMALVNQQALANGSSLVGFINPVLYPLALGAGYGTDFHDITSGSNGAYSAVTGYDLVTGWGSPGGVYLIDALSGSGGPYFTLTANPSNLGIVQGGSGKSAIAVNPVNGFSGTVTLSASGLPSGVTAKFKPSSTASTSTLTLTASGSAATGPAVVTINGVSGSLTWSTTMNLVVTASGTSPVVTLSATSLAFGNLVAGETSKARPVTVTNAGNATLVFSNIAFNGDFVQASANHTCGITLAPGKKCVIDVAFTPTQLGARSGTLTITDNAANSPQTVSLSGTGTVQATLTPAAAIYPAKKVGTASLPKVFTLTNKQNSATLDNIVITTTGDFSISGTTCGTSLNPLDICVISVVFTPTATGTRTGTLSVSDSAINSPQISTLTGTGK